jgi:hypothetical protein
MPSSGIWGLVSLVETDVSEERVASICRVERMSEIETLVFVHSVVEFASYS